MKKAFASRILGIAILLGSTLLFSACALTDRGIAKIQLETELSLGLLVDEVRDHWYLYSKKRLQIDPLSAEKGYLTYRGVSYDPGVTSFILYFSIKDKQLKHVEFRYRPSLTEMKTEQLLNEWSAKLGKPSVKRRWGTHQYIWTDRKARLEIYVGDGICQLHHRLR